ncbi:unnamed protein product, partial [Laminaria digitata]
QSGPLSDVDWAAVLRAYSFHEQGPELNKYDLQLPKATWFADEEVLIANHCTQYLGTGKFNTNVFGAPWSIGLEGNPNIICTLLIARSGIFTPVCTAFRISDFSAQNDTRLSKPAVLFVGIANRGAR